MNPIGQFVCAYARYCMRLSFFTGFGNRLNLSSKLHVWLFLDPQKVLSHISRQGARLVIVICDEPWYLYLV